MNKGHCIVCNWDNQWRDDNGKCISCWIDEDDKNLNLTLQTNGSGDDEL